jgi:hypothetical protein
MHWFDRATQQLAEAPQRSSSTRRTVLKGAAFAALAAPFGGTAVTYASNQLRRVSSDAECIACLTRASENYNTSVAICDIVERNKRPLLLKPKGGSKGKPTGGKGKKKKKKGVKPAEAAKHVSCLGEAFEDLYHQINGCRIAQCSGAGGEGPRLEDPHTQKCPAGTLPCAEGLCCYGGDKCCSCPGNGGVAGPQGGAICCASVVGCECCGAA